MGLNTGLNSAKRKKDDEFYTFLSDVEAELIHYADCFRGKAVYCNCDDLAHSAFWEYFHRNFSQLGLKSLVSTYYDDCRSVYKAEYTGGNDSDIGICTMVRLSGSGDFRSEECVSLLDACDIVVTNPPFSLFREYISLLMDRGKGFLIIGNMNAACYKEIFPFVRDNRLWFGYTKPKRFLQPDGCCKAFGNILWYTNLDIPKHHEPLLLSKVYMPEEYPQYDNFDAINVDRLADIPADYFGCMGVPITYLDRHCPEQFEIVGLLQSSTDAQAGIPNLRYYDGFKEVRQDGMFTGSSGRKANGHPVLVGRPDKGSFLYNPVTGEYAHAVYARVVIRRRVRI